MPLRRITATRDSGARVDEHRHLASRFLRRTSLQQRRIRRAAHPERPYAPVCFRDGFGNPLCSPKNGVHLRRETPGSFPCPHHAEPSQYIALVTATFNHFGTCRHASAFYFKTGTLTLDPEGHGPLVAVYYASDLACLAGITQVGALNFVARLQERDGVAVRRMVGPQDSPRARQVLEEVV